MQKIAKTTIANLKDRFPFFHTFGVDNASLAAFLDPRFKKLNFVDDILKAEVVSGLHSMMESDEGVLTPEKNLEFNAAKKTKFSLLIRSINAEINSDNETCHLLE